MATPQLEEAAVKVKIEEHGKGYSITVDPWEISLHRERGPNAIRWELVGGAAISVQFDAKGHFRNPWPVGVGEQLASTGLLASGAVPGTYKYSIKLATAPPQPRIIVVDPDYMIEED